MLIFGSTAIKHWFPGWYLKQPNDLDIISKDQTLKQKGTEVYWTDAFEFLLENNKDELYVDPDLIYTIKVSHAAWDINWTKHIKDIIFLKEMGCKINKDFYDLLFKDWEKLHGKKKYNFNKPNDELFKDSVTRKYSHDDLHNILKFNDQPMYQKILKDKDKALCSQVLFEQLSERRKHELAVEEVAVVAYERYVLTGKMPFKNAICKAYQDLVTHMTKGWFNLYLIEHAKDIIYLPKYYRLDFDFLQEKGNTLCQ